MNEPRQFPEERYPHQDITEKIIGAAPEVHRVLGTGFTEPVYQEAMEIEMRTRAIRFEAQKELHIDFKGTLLKKKFRCDLLVEDVVVVELKAASNIAGELLAVLMNYLKASKRKVGLILNFGRASLQIKRVVL